MNYFERIMHAADFSSMKNTYDNIRRIVLGMEICAVETVPELGGTMGVLISGHGQKYVGDAYSTKGANGKRSVSRNTPTLEKGERSTRAYDEVVVLVEKIEAIWVRTYGAGRYPDSVDELATELKLPVVVID